MSDELIRLGGGANYSTEEQIIGKWVDGRPLYQKTFEYKTSWSGTTGFRLGTLDADVDFGFIHDGYYINQYANFGPVGSAFMLTNTGRNTDTAVYDTYAVVNTVNASDKFVYMYCGTNTAGSYVTCTVRYTKLSDL